MEASIHKLLLPAAMSAIWVFLAGCNGEEVVRESLASEHAARLEAPAGQPPVPPEWLTIPPSDLPPTETPWIDPDPILPTMDEVYKTRRVPNAEGDLLEWKKPKLPSQETKKEYQVKD